MTMPTSVIVDIVFVPIYVVLAFASILNVIKHGRGKTAGFIYLVIFSTIRLVGNILLIYSYHNNYKNLSIVEWGYILQGLGYSFLISATLGFYGRATSDGTKGAFANFAPGLLQRGNSQESNQRDSKPILQKGLYLVNLAALVLLILGYTDSDDVFAGLLSGNTTTGTLDAKAKIGDIIFLALTAAIAALVSFRLAREAHQNLEQRLILKFILGALPFMAVRAAYVLYQSFTTDPFRRNLAVKTVLQYVMEVVVNIIYCIMGAVIGRQVQQWDVEVSQATY